MYNESTSILCHNHFLILYNEIESEKCKKGLYLAQENKIMKIKEKLVNYINENRYNSSLKPTREEGEALEEAIILLRGGSEDEWNSF